MMKYLALTFALIFTSPAWATNPATIYVNSGGAATNSGTTDNNTAPLNNVASGTACSATCTAAWTTGAGGTSTATASWVATATSITVTNGDCTNASAGAGVWDTTLGSNGLIGIIASCTTTTLTLATGGALQASSGSTDALYFSAPITLSSAATLGTTPGCTNEGSGSYLCDGSQMIYLGNATNTNAKVFIIAGFTACAGSGTCIIGVGASATANAGSPNPTCSSCSGSTWAIGGRILFPDTSIEGSFNPGQTINIENSQSCGAASCLTMRAASSGDQILGPLIVSPTGFVTLSATGNNSVIASSGAPAYWRWLAGITFTNTGLSTNPLVNVGSSTPVSFDGEIFTMGSSATTGACLSGSGPYMYVTNSKFTFCGGPGISETSGSGHYIFGNYFSGTFKGTGITVSGANPAIQIINNIMIGDATATQAILLSGASTSPSNNATIMNNTIANWETGGLVVSNIKTNVRLYNNIFYENQLTSGYNVSYPAGNLSDMSLLAGGAHGCNDFYVASGSNLSNFTAAANDITTTPSFVSAGTDWSLNTSTPSLAINVGCYQQPGGYTTANNYTSIGALQLNGSGASSSTQGGIIGGGL